jgi:hypothetical protein
MPTSLTPIYARNKAILLKQETTYGTDAAPVAAQATLVANFTFTPEATPVDRPLDLPGGGARPSTATQIHASVSFDAEIAYAGAAGIVPLWGGLLKICGFSETVVASTSVTYNTISSGFLSGTIYFYEGGNLYKLVGVRLAAAVKIEAGKNPVFSVTGKGLLVNPSSAAIPGGINLSSYPTPKPVLVQNTNVFTFNAVAMALKQMDIPAGFTPNYGNLVNDEQIRNGFREIKGVKLTVRQGLISEFDPFALQRNNTPVPIVLTHGGSVSTTPVVDIKIPNFQIEKISDDTLDDEKTWVLEGRAQAAFTGDGDIQIVCRLMP